mmetsp:Transcript_28060/g.44987  ORF Transcript_28060/g.44987 Transcript_28060/m.44987 type:complete len:228 (-) Transcript_28060:2784-3467(-)
MASTIPTTISSVHDSKTCRKTVSIAPTDFKYKFGFPSGTLFSLSSISNAGARDLNSEIAYRPVVGSLLRSPLSKLFINMGIDLFKLPAQRFNTFIRWITASFGRNCRPVENRLHMASSKDLHRGSVSLTMCFMISKCVILVSPSEENTAFSYFSIHANTFPGIIRSSDELSVSRFFRLANFVMIALIQSKQSTAHDWHSSKQPDKSSGNSWVLSSLITDNGNVVTIA